MAENTTATTKNVVLDTITRFFTRDGVCRVDVAKYLAAVHIKPCDEEGACWQTIACKRAIELPEQTREMIEVSGSEACDLLGDATSWKEYVPDATLSLAEWAQDLYYTPDRFALARAAFLSNSPYIVVIDIADTERTQFAFRAYLTTLASSFPANEDTEVAMIPTTWQPTGEPFVTSGVNLSICS